MEHSRLDWTELDPERPDTDSHRSLLEWYRALIALRRSRPELTEPWLAEVSVDYDETDRWLVVGRGSLRVAVNLADRPQQVPLYQAAGKILLASDDHVSLAGPNAIDMAAESVAVVEPA